MRDWLRFLLGSFASAIACTGCGGGVSHGSQNDMGAPDSGMPVVPGSDGAMPPALDSGSVTPEQACDAYYDVYCKQSEICTPFLARWLDGIGPECKARYAPGCAARFRALGDTESPASLVACAQALQRLSCEEYNFGTTWPAQCRTMPGTLLDGSACAFNQQCQGSYCKKPDKMRSTYLCGVCATRSQAGGPCTTAFDCEDAAFNCLQGICTTLVPAGGVCDTDHPCAGFYSCIGLSATSPTGSCGKPLGLGAPCNPDPLFDVCDYFLAGLFCDPTSSRCAPRTLVPLGQNCMASDGTTLDCASAAHCNPNEAGQYTCSPGTPEGMACTSPYECASTSKCFNGVCTAVDANLCH